MNTGVVSMRYAKALFAYAKEQGVEDAIYRNMLQLMATL
jgi:F0F1-type ATP synthase delta subunit